MWRIHHTTARRTYPRALSVFVFLAVLVLPAQAQTPPYDHPLFTGSEHVAPEPSFDLQHLRLALGIQGATLHAEARLLFNRIVPADSLLLHAPGLALDSAFVGLPDMPDSSFVPTPVRLEADGTWWVVLDSLVQEEATLELRLSYHGEPRRGLRIQPDNVLLKAWTQQRPGDVFHWIPLPDVPADRWTADLHITADSSLHVFASGQRHAEEPTEDGRVIHHFSVEHPIPAQGLAFAMGTWEILEESAWLPVGTRVPLTQAVPPERLGDAARSLGPAVGLLQALSDSLRAPFPWASYAQAVVRPLAAPYTSGAGLALVDEAALFDERALLADTPAPRLAETLARQWFGASLSPRFWSHVWMTEGAATYLSTILAPDETAPTLPWHQLATTYLDEAQRYRRPLVWSRWTTPQHLFDAHSAAKGAWVYRMLRLRLGDGAFWEMLQRLVEVYAYRPVETVDLERSAEAASGEPQDSFFEQWVYAAGHPVLEVEYEHDPGEGVLTITVVQQQNGFEVPEVFDLDLAVEVATLSDVLHFRLPLSEHRQEFFFPMPAPPRFLVVDPDVEWLAEVRLEQDIRAWMAQLRQAPSAVHRIQAAKALTAFADDPALVIGMRSAIRQEEGAAVRQAIVETLGALPPEPAIERLLREEINDPESVVRAAIVEALGTYPSEDVQALVLDRAQNDPAYPVQAAAVRTLARTNSPVALDVIRSALITPAHRDVIRQAAFEALAYLDPQPSDALDLARQGLAQTSSPSVRQAAVRYLATQASSRSALALLREALGDNDPNVRAASIRALGASGAAGREALQDRLTVESEPLLLDLLREYLGRSAD